ncbi:hypothetical protein [Marinobacter sp.]|uniref:hypothetical protein n=1 Tax=Marinobacter sp. TaxID=50741 RepID=UPI000C545C2D|nr:hypothetical protein [Marinobacter sp.]MBE94712.1 hypothetical protein [Marinobacter sp.]
MPTKNLDKYSQVKPSIAFPSKKNRRQMFCESRVEVGRLLELEFDPTVKRYLTQPDSYSYTRDGKQRRYTPDILCQGTDGTFWFEEVKSWKGANDQSFLEKHQFLTELFADVIGHPLRLRISETPYNCAWRGNLQFLYRYLDHSFSHASYRVMMGIRHPETVRSILQMSSPEQISMQSIFAGLAQGLLSFDRFKKVNLYTNVWGADHE